MSVNINEREDIVEVKQILTDHIEVYDNSTRSDSPGGGWGSERIKQKGARPYKLATGSVLLLCALLLFTIMGLCVHISRERHELRAITTNLTGVRDLLESTNANLTRERDAFKTSNTLITKEKEQLESTYAAVVSERDQLNATYTNTHAEKVQLQANYNTLSKDKDQLQNRYNELKRDRESLNTSYVNLENERNDMQKGLLDLGWRYFDSHLYYISTMNKSWDDARQDCKSRGADLIKIDSQEEQEFVSSFNKEAWIGLSDVNIEGQWRWVDGSPLTTKFWAKDQPNSYKGEQDCVKLWLSPPLENWNDEKCSIVHTWICEKLIQR
ncbi:C-type lectin domain family 4 member F-like [Alosa sapidissima]|uniref:C-type lectin domain family 4 member F-like n=1 Tax=Alosa sapidissima TaxID=34773 RepID=UPI001C08EE08|nr:C-type lectin domain family 4 member F-like [Alosa sapidissima]